MEKSFEEALEVLNNDTNDPSRRRSEDDIHAWACMAMQTVEQSDQPNSIKQAYERPDAKLYDIAIKKEMKQFQKFKTFTFVKKKDVPKDAKVIPSKFHQQN